MSVPFLLCLPVAVCASSFLAATTCDHLCSLAHAALQTFAAAPPWTFPQRGCAQSPPRSHSRTRSYYSRNSHKSRMCIEVGECDRHQRVALNAAAAPALTPGRCRPKAPGCASCPLQGNKALYKYCEEMSVPHRRTGKLVVATNDACVAGGLVGSCTLIFLFCQPPAFCLRPIPSPAAHHLAPSKTSKPPGAFLDLLDPPTLPPHPCPPAANCPRCMRCMRGRRGAACQASSSCLAPMPHSSNRWCSVRCVRARAGCDEVKQDGAMSRQAHLRRVCALGHLGRRPSSLP